MGSSKRKDKMNKCEKHGLGAGKISNHIIIEGKTDTKSVNKLCGLPALHRYHSK